MNNILVTGGTGFFGRHLTRHLRSEGNKVFVSNSRHGNLKYYDQFLSTFDNNKFDSIYHLAAKTKAGDYCLTHSGEQWIDNQTINTNIIRYWVTKQSYANFITMGTSCAYGEGNLSLFEDRYMDGKPEEGLYTYAQTKRMLYVGLLAVKRQYNLDFKYLIPSTLYGPGFDKDDCHFIFDLIRKIYDGYYNNKDVVLWGDGSQVRELLHVNDAITLMNAFTAQDKTDIANMTTSTYGSIKYFAEQVCNLIGYDPTDIQYDRSRYVGNKERILHHGPSTTILGNNYVHDLKLTPLVEGLEETINYYHEHFGNR